MTDGSRLHDSWLAALKHAQTRFRSLLAGSSSEQWRRIPTPSSTRDSIGNGAPHPQRSGKIRPRVSDVVIHRHTGKGNDVIRVALEIPAEEGLESLGAWKAVLTTPELRKEWDPTVDASHVVETCFDPDTRISKTDFTLGWPANPRDAITISRTFTDATTVIDISTSLPRSADEPAYLRPAPPFVRSHVHLFAWCIQLIAPPSESSSKSSQIPKVRITCFWQHDLKAIWGTAKLSQNLPSMVIGLLRAVRKRGDRIPILSGWGNGVGIDTVAFNVDREALKLDYSIFGEESSADYGIKKSTKDDFDVRVFKERKRLERSVEIVLPMSHGWDIQITTRASTEESSQTPWTATATRIVHTTLVLPEADMEPPSPPSTSSSTPPSPSAVETVNGKRELVVLRFSHPKPGEHSILKVKIVVERSGGSNALRINGSPHAIQDSESRDPVSFSMSKELVEDASSISGLSFQTVATTETRSSSSTTQPVVRTSSDRTPAAEKSVLSLVRRNYIYFTSLLQEPEAKWRHVNESRGVTISQLDSIDPTLVVYRAEAVFVGIGVWDLLSIVKTPGAKVYWDKGFDDAVLLEDVNELTELWHHKAKAAWPVNARDSVLLSTSYKSPTAVHVFSFSTDDRHIFRTIPPSDPTIIRTQVDLQGWAIEALSPTTTLLTLLDQSDPKGWSNKSSIPQQMVAALAGVGEFAIKCGGPPVATRFGGAKVVSMKYDHEKSTFKVEYEGSESRRHSLISANDMLSGAPEETVLDLGDMSSGRGTPRPPSGPPPAMPKVECEIRCDVDTWSASLELVVDPPPQGISCLKRHRLSSSGGGMWITIEHDAVFVGDDRILVTVRKGSATGSKDKNGIVIVNGLKVKVDVEDLPEAEVKTLTKQKRVKPVRIPLDQPPVLGVIRRRRLEWEEEGDSDSIGDGSRSPTRKDSASPGQGYSSPLRNFFTAAVEQTVSATVATANVFTPATFVNPSASANPASPGEHPMRKALEAVQYIREYHAKPSSIGWNVVTDKGVPVHKKLEPELSSAIAIHRAEKVIEGISAGEVGAAVANLDLHKLWDDRHVSHKMLEDYGAGCSTAFVVKRSGFPFRDRAFWVATAVAQLSRSAPHPHGNGDLPKSSQPPYSPTIFIASVSFDPSYSSSPTSTISAEKVNPFVYPVGHLTISGWIIEAVDPYLDEYNHPIPSTRCVHFVGIDYRGSVPVAFNNTMNATLPKTELAALEGWLRGKAGLGAGPVIRVPAPSLAVPQITRKVLKSITADGPTKSSTDWQLEDVDVGRTLLTTKIGVERSTFSALLALRPAILAPPPVDEDSHPVMMPQPRRLSSVHSSDSPRGTLRLGRASPSPTAHSTSLESSSSSVTLRSRRQSGSGTPTRPVLPGHQRYPSTSLPATPYKGNGVTRARALSSESTDAVFERLTIDDPVVAEISVNFALYPHGYRVEMNAALQPTDQTIDLSKGIESLDKLPLPLNATVYTVPPSPLLSMASDTPTPRHLLCVTLPVAQYYAPAIVDPLTGENRLPPAKPDWLLQFERSSAVVDIQITAINGKAGASPKESGGPVTFNGRDVAIIGERRSVSSVGREFLEADGSHCMPVLLSSNSTAGTDKPVPALRQPIAIAKDMLAEVKPPPPVEVTPSEVISPTEPSQQIVVVSGGTDPEQEAPPRTTSGFFNLWNASSMLLSLRPQSAAPPSPMVSIPLPQDAVPEDGKVQDPPTPLTLPNGSSSPAPTAPALSTRAGLVAPDAYRLSTVLIIALISFLFGSLIRSLASPADFIYFTSSIDAPLPPSHVATSGGEGWREVRRLLEFKRGLFGWDVVIAVVRRP